jgi:hypothetical protein
MHSVAPLAAEIIRDRTKTALGERPAPELPPRGERASLAPARAAAARALRAAAKLVEPAPRCGPAGA